MPVQTRRFPRILRRGLIDDDLACVELADVEAVLARVDAEGPHAVHDGTGAVAPAVEDAAGVGAEGDDVAEDLELGEGFVNGYGVALAVAFYGGGEAAKAWGGRERV